MGILYLAIWFLLGAITAYCAQIRGRDPIAWFGIGLLFGLIGLAFLYYLPVLEQKTPPPSVEKVEPEPWTYKDWFYLDHERAIKGPLPFRELRQRIDEGDLPRQTLVWSEGMADWESSETAMISSP